MSKMFSLEIIFFFFMLSWLLYWTLEKVKHIFGTGAETRNKNESLLIAVLAQAPLPPLSLCLGICGEEGRRKVRRAIPPHAARGSSILMPLRNSLQRFPSNACHRIHWSANRHMWQFLFLLFFGSSNAPCGLSIYYSISPSFSLAQPLHCSLWTNSCFCHAGDFRRCANSLKCWSSWKVSLWV